MMTRSELPTEIEQVHWILRNHEALERQNGDAPCQPHQQIPPLEKLVMWSWKRMLPHFLIATTKYRDGPLE
jgi:hypothetical protein